MMRALLVLCVAALPAFSAIDGTVVNGTTGKPQAGVSIALVKPGQGGMRTLGSTVSDAGGRFAFAKDEPGGGPQLLQANYGGVNYNKLLTPNIPTSGVELNIFEATKDPGVAHVANRMLLLEPNLSQIAVNETVIVQNQSKRTFSNDALGGMLFYLPPAANGQVRVSAQGPQGMPLPRTAEKTGETDVFKVSFAIKPGETEFQVSYTLPAGTPFTFRDKVVGIKGMVTTPLRLIAPPGVTLSGKDIRQLGTEPNTQATIYNVNATGLYSFDIAGTGSLHPAEQQDAAGGQESTDAPQVTEGAPLIYSHLSWLIGLALAVLGTGLVLLFRSSPVENK